MSQSKTQFFFRNPNEAAKSPIFKKDYNKNQGISSKKVAQLTSLGMRDLHHHSQSKLRATDSINELPSEYLDYNEENDKSINNKLNMTLEKMVMGTASTYKYPKIGKVCMPTLIKAIEVGKVSKLMEIQK